MAAYNAAGSFSPIALEPYPIETTLASQAAAGSPATARLLLNQYELERGANRNLYTDEINSQRQMGWANLHQQMVDRAVKTMADAAQHPEMAPYLFGSQYGQEAMGPGDPGAYQQLQTNLGTAASLGRAKTAAEIIQAGAAGGGMPDLDQLSGATGLRFNLIDPTSVRAGFARSAGQAPHMGHPETVQVSTGDLRDAKPFNVPVTYFPEVDSPASYAQRVRDTLVANGYSEDKTDALHGKTIPDIMKSMGIPYSPGGGTSTPGLTGTTQTRLPPNANAPVDQSKTGGGNELLGGLDTSSLTTGLTNAGQPIPGQTQNAPTGLRPPPAGTTYAPTDTGSQQTPAATGGAQAAPVTPQVQDTPHGQAVLGRTPAEAAALQRAIVGVTKLPQAQHDQVISLMTQNKLTFPIVVARGGAYYYADRNGTPIARVP